MTDDEVALEAVRHLHEAWLAAELRGDVAGLLALCTPDVRWLTPDSGMLLGREAGRRVLTDTQAELDSIVATDLHVEIRGDLGYKTSRYETRYRLSAQGELHVSRGTHLWILRREGADWRVALVTWQVER
ncbi:MAG: nuclear transport factor 2 family protein [Gemmatimonadales bacterium]